MFTLAQIIQWVLIYKYYILFPVMVVEGPTITIIAGFLVSLGQLNFFLVLLAAVVANLVSDTILYAIGRWGRKWWKYFGLKPEKIQQVESHFERHKIKTLIFGKIALGIGNVALVAAGMGKMAYGKYIWINFLIEVPKSLIFLLVGFYFGRAYNIIDQYLQYATIFAVAGAIIIFAVYEFVRWWVAKHYKEL